jgi:hypothetical protein
LSHIVENALHERGTKWRWLARIERTLTTVSSNEKNLTVEINPGDNNNSCSNVSKVIIME